MPKGVPHPAYLVLPPEELGHQGTADFVCSTQDRFLRGSPALLEREVVCVFEWYLSRVGCA